jgi:ribonuclease HII
MNGSVDGSFYDAYERIAGVDEVGRGALFGPVVAAAVILPRSVQFDLAAAGVTDSKRLSPTARQHLAQRIQAVAVDCRIGVASVREIDRMNILQASLLAMKRSIDRLTPQPDLCLIDGNQRVPGLIYPQQSLVKGDQSCLAIAAASIVAKVWRDELIVRLAAKYPGYDLVMNKGYGTAKHRLGLKQIGISKQHRRSFSPCQVELDPIEPAQATPVQTDLLQEELYRIEAEMQMVSSNQ